MVMLFCLIMYSNSRVSSRAIGDPASPDEDDQLLCLDGLAGADLRASNAHASESEAGVTCDMLFS